MDEVSLCAIVPSFVASSRSLSRNHQGIKNERHKLEQRHDARAGLELTKMFHDVSEFLWLCLIVLIGCL